MTIKACSDEFLDHLAYQKRYSKHTITAYRTDLYAFCDYVEVFYESTDPSTITRRMVSSFIADLADGGITPRSINRKLSAIQSFFNHAVRADWVSQNPARNVQRPKVGRHLPKVMREGQVRELFSGSHFEDDFEGVRDHALLVIFYACGLRREELIGLKLEDVNLTSGQVKVLGKRNKERILPIGGAAKEVLGSYFQKRKKEFDETQEPWVFLTAKGQKLYPNLVYKVVKNYLSKVTTMDQKSPHVLRHTFATHLLNEGANLQSIKELLGHSSLGTTQVYTHTSLEKLKDVYKQAHPRSKN